MKYRSAIYGFMFVILLFLGLLLFNDDRIISFFFLFASTLFLLCLLNFKCPRCKLGIDSQGYWGYKVGYLPSDDCAICGRTRKGVWPFQYLVAPEKWEGADTIDQ